MKQFLAHITLLSALILYVPCTAQNLVPNPSFENYNACPTGISGLEYSPGYVSFPTVQSWINPMQVGSADYFNSCASAGSYVSIPGNAFGYQPARTGNGYIGIIAWEGSMQGSTLVNVYGEYVQCKLSQPMIAGARYCINFYVNNAVSKATYNYVGINNMGVNFSSSKPTQATGYTMSLPYSVGNPAFQFLTDTSGWMKVTGIYTAAGGETWMTMGWFDNGSVPVFQPVLPAVPNPRDNYRCYLYMDDVSVVKMSNVDTFYSVQDTTICTPKALNITLESKAQLADYWWSNGTTLEKLAVSDTGTYWCIAATGCMTYIDTFRIRYKPAPVLNLGKELVNCENQPITINANYPNSTYLWNTGATTESITVNKSGIYNLLINNECGAQSDTVHVYIQPPTPIPVATDTMICQYTTTPVIKVSGTNLTWYTSMNGNFGSKNQPPVITREPGSYALFVTQTVGKCESGRAPVKVEVTYTPHEELGDKVVMCDNDIQVIGKEVPGVEYKWNTGANTCCVYPDREGLYKLAMTNTCGSFIDSIWVYHTPCDDCIVFPNAFTPVKDYSNNIFKPILKCPVDQFNIRIFNRWGNMVYESTDVYEGWTGRYNYDWAPVGTYVYMVEYRAKGKQQQQVITGNVTLLR